MKTGGGRESRSTGIWAQKHGNKVETAVRTIIGGWGGNGKVEGEKISTIIWLAQYRGRQVVSKILCGQHSFREDGMISERRGRDFAD